LAAKAHNAVPDPLVGFLTTRSSGALKHLCATSRDLRYCLLPGCYKSPDVTSFRYRLHLKVLFSQQLRVLKTARPRAAAPVASPQMQH